MPTNDREMPNENCPFCGNSVGITQHLDADDRVKDETVRCKPCNYTMPRKKFLKRANPAAQGDVAGMVIALEEIREIYSGSELGEPIYAQEAYAIRLVKECYETACKALTAYRAAAKPHPAPVQSQEVGEAEQLAQRFHEAYERLAPSFSYETRKASAKPWAEVPENNKRLMIAVCAEIQAATQNQPAGSAEVITKDDILAACQSIARSIEQRHGTTVGYDAEDIISAEIDNILMNQRGRKALSILTTGAKK